MKLLKLKNTLYEKKISLDQLNARVDHVKRNKLNKHEVMTIEIIKTLAQREKTK